MQVELDVNGETHAVDVEPRTTLLDCLRDKLLLNGAHAGCEHGVCGACTVLLDGEPVRSCLMFAVQADGYAITTIEGLTPGPGELIVAAGCVLRDARHAVRLLHAGDDPRRARAACDERRSRRARTSSRPSPATSAAAPAMRRSSRRSRSPPSACAAPNSAGGPAMSAPGQIPLRFVRPPRARGPPLCGRQGQLRRRYRAAGRQARRAGDLPASGGAHRRRSTKPRRWRCRACITCSTAPSLPARPAAGGRPRYAERAALSAGRGRGALCRRMGRRGGGRHAARSPRTPPSWSRSTTSRCRSCSTPRRPTSRQPAGASRRTARTCCSTAPSSGARSRRISPRARTSSRYRVKWGRSSTVPIETFGVTASWDPWREILDVWASIQMPKYPDQIARALRCR